MDTQTPAPQQDPTVGSEPEQPGSNPKHLKTSTSILTLAAVMFVVGLAVVIAQAKTNAVISFMEGQATILTTKVSTPTPWPTSTSTVMGYLQGRIVNDVNGNGITSPSEKENFILDVSNKERNCKKATVASGFAVNYQSMDGKVQGSIAPKLCSGNDPFYSVSVPIGAYYVWLTKPIDWIQTDYTDFGKYANVTPGNPSQENQPWFYVKKVGSGSIIGRIVYDGEKLTNGKYDVGETYIKEPKGSVKTCQLEAAVSGFTVRVTPTSYFGPSFYAVANHCDPYPYYKITVPAGKYTVYLDTMPAGWRATFGITSIPGISVAANSLGRPSPWFYVHKTPVTPTPTRTPAITVTATPPGTPPPFPPLP